MVATPKARRCPTKLFIGRAEPYHDFGTADDFTPHPETEPSAIAATHRRLVADALILGVSDPAWLSQLLLLPVGVVGRHLRALRGEPEPRKGRGFVRRPGSW